MSTGLCSNQNDVSHSNWVRVSVSSIYENDTSYQPENMLSDNAEPPSCEANGDFYITWGPVPNATVVWDVSCEIVKLEKIILRNTANTHVNDRLELK